MHQLTAAHGLPGTAPGTASTLIDHVAVITKDADKASAWYEERLGLRKTTDEIIESVGARLVWLFPQGRGPGGIAAGVQILEPQREGPAMTHLDEKGEGLHHICFVVADLAASLASNGQSTGGVFAGGHGLPCAFLDEKPLGVVIELVERSIVTRL